jgi:thiamine phosphate synthase YjbQ (UPF0047 family)
MSELQCLTQSISVDLKTGCDIKDITHEVNNVIKKNKISTGMVNIFIIGSTGSVTTIEYEPGVVEDLKQAIDTLAPVGLEYAHEKAWHDPGNHTLFIGEVVNSGINSTGTPLCTLEYDGMYVGKQ